MLVIMRVVSQFERQVPHRKVTLPERSWTCLRRHENGLCDVVEDLQKELCVGAGLGGRLDFGRVQLAGLSAASGRLEDAVDGGEDRRREELGAHGAHVEVHQGRGQRGAAEERRRLLLFLDLDAVQSGEQIRLALVKSVIFNDTRYKEFGQGSQNLLKLAFHEFFFPT